MQIEQAKALSKKDFHKSAAHLKFPTRNFIDGRRNRCREAMSRSTQSKPVWTHLG